MLFYITIPMYIKQISMFKAKYFQNMCARIKIIIQFATKSSTPYLRASDFYVIIL